MNLGLLFGFLQLGLDIAAAHAGGNVDEIAKTGPTLRKMAQAVDKLYLEEVGQPLDWSKIHEHEHLE